MVRVAKRGGLVLFMDEQLYEQATGIERAYFHGVLSTHNTIHAFPRDLLPAELTGVEVHQIYQFYYLCFGIKA
jgi:hypothetical protein